jgi:uncharacterized membrane protein
MSLFPLHAKVECTDGAAGTLTNVIISPASRKITHIAVRTGEFETSERLVPINRIAETTHDTVRLQCTKSQLMAMQDFNEVHYIEDRYPRSYGSPGMYYMPEATIEPHNIPIIEQRIPPGELSITHGMAVHASDGDVGSVEEFIVEPSSGAITHIVLRTGPRVNRQEVVVPVSGIARVAEATVELKLTRSEVAALPPVPVKRQYDWSAQEQRAIEMVVLTFPNPDQGSEALRALKKVAEEHKIELINAAVLLKHPDGKVAAKDFHDLGLRRGALFGAVIGGLLSVLVPPVGLLGAAAAGALAGGASASLIDMGFPKAYLEQLQNSLQPGSSAVVMLIEQERVDEVLLELARFNGTLLRQPLTPEMVDQLTTSVGDQRERNK